MLPVKLMRSVGARLERCARYQLEAIGIGDVLAHLVVVLNEYAGLS